jgi:uncharacterized protein (TIGR03435 family)
MRSNGFISRVAIVMAVWVVWFGGSAGVWAQTLAENSEAKLPVFSIVSVKRSAANETKTSFLLTPDGFVARRWTLFSLLASAYRMPEARMIVGVPGWGDNELYDIDAKVDGADIEAMAKLSQEQRFAMLQPVLEDRFKLKYHYETRELADFGLVVAKGGPNAENLKPSDPSHTKPTWKYAGRYVLTGLGFTMEELCFLVLSTESQRFVVDKTGLTGRYDVSLRWSREALDGSATAEAAGPSIFTAVQEQLGLRLEPIKVATKIIVVDSVERPSGN